VSVNWAGRRQVTCAAPNSLAHCRFDPKIDPFGREEPAVTSGAGYPSLPAEAAAHLMQSGYRRCFYALYSTKQNDVLAGVVKEAKANILPQDSLIMLVSHPERHEALSPEVQTHFIDGQQTLVARECTRPIVGSYLAFITPLSGQTGNEDAIVADISRRTEECAALLSLMHGEFVALERHFVAILDLAANSASLTTPPLFIRQTSATEHLDQGLARIVDEERNCALTDHPKAMALISRAHHEEDGAIKFLIMWMAVEAVLGNGHKRKHFALSVMQSEPLNEMINHLREKREAAVHDGELTELDQKDYLRVKCLVLMALSQNPQLRVRILDYLINVLALDVGVH